MGRREGGSENALETSRLGKRYRHRWALREATIPRWDRAPAASLLRGHDIDLRERVDRLSGGQRTLVALALAVGKRAGLVVLDEPLADLDPLARVQVMGVLRGLEATVLLSSHILADLTEACDHLILLGSGRVRLCGSFAGLLSTQPRCPCFAS